MASPDLKLDVNTELAARRTGMAFQRTRLAEDRTLMAVIRTALSLIGFGFTIFQFFQRLKEQDVISRAGAPRHFGLRLVWPRHPDAGCSASSITSSSCSAFAACGSRCARIGLIHGETGFPVSLTLITALLLLAVGVAAIASMEFQIGPFG